MIYHPDKWLVLKFITPDETFYKLFACWAGGYTHGDSWKLNSGITSVVAKGNTIEFLGNSGSIYSCKFCYDEQNEICNFDLQGTTGYGAIVLSGLIESASAIGTNIEVVKFDSIVDILNFNWKG